MNANEFDTLMTKWAKIQENSGGYGATSSLNVGGMGGRATNRYHKSRTLVGFAEDEVGYLDKLMAKLKAIPENTSSIASLQCYYLYGARLSIERLEIPKATFHYWKNKGIKLLINELNVDSLHKNASMPVLR